MDDGKSLKLWSFQTVGMIQMGQGWVECSGDCIASGSVAPVGELMAVQTNRDFIDDVLQDDPFEVLHDYWGQRNRALVVKAGDSWFPRHRNKGRFEKDRDCGME